MMNITWDELKHYLFYSANGTVARIEFLVVANTIFLLTMFCLDSYRHRSRSRAVRGLLLLLDTFADTLTTYTLGLMQLVQLVNVKHEDGTMSYCKQFDISTLTEISNISIPTDCFNIELLAVWALLLITFKDKVRYISAYSLRDKDNRRTKEMRNLLDSLLVANLIATKGNKFKLPLWVLWALNLLKTVHSIRAFDLADRSYAHGRNARLVEHYMRLQLHNNNDDDGSHHDKCLVFGEAGLKVLRQSHYQAEVWKDHNNNNHDNKVNNQYLVLGGTELKVLREPHYQTKLWVIHERKLITFDKVRQCPGSLLEIREEDKSNENEDKSNENEDKSNENEAKQVQRRQDICLSFALYKLLRRRFEGLDDHMHDEEREKNKKMIVVMLEKKNSAERVFRIIRKELAFLNDYLHTTFPIVFATGLPYIYLVYTGLSGIGYWLAVQLLVDLQNPSEIGHDGASVVVTFVVIVLVRLGEMWEIVTYILSDWCKVLMLCKYVQKTSWHKSKVAAKLLGFLCNIETLIMNWHNRIGQYRFLESFNYTPTKQNLLSQASLGMFPRVVKGTRERIGRLTNEVEVAIVNSLRGMLIKPSFDHDHRPGNDVDLVDAITENGVREHVGWACRLPTYMNTLLVWHIATALCEMHLSLPRSPPDLRGMVTSSRKEISPGYFSRCFNDIRSLLGLRSADRNRDQEHTPESRLRSSFMAATSLSQYCAYLLAFVPDLLPERSLDKESRLSSTVERARSLLSGCRGMEQIYDKMMKMGSAEAKAPTSDTKKELEEVDYSILHQGARLAYILISELDDCKVKNDVEANPGAGINKTNSEEVETSSSSSSTIEAELKRWKILEEFWTEFILRLAASDNVNVGAHALNLHKGGEFITQLWALLYHAGVLSPPSKHHASPMAAAAAGPGTRLESDDDDDDPDKLHV